MADSNTPTITEVAAILDVSPRDVLHLTHRGQLQDDPALRASGSTVQLGDLYTYAESNPPTLWA